jgi:hypothetical protein
LGRSREQTVTIQRIAGLEAKLASYERFIAEQSNNESRARGLATPMLIVALLGAVIGVFAWRPAWVICLVCGVIAARQFFNARDAALNQKEAMRDTEAIKQELARSRGQLALVGTVQPRK